MAKEISLQNQDLNRFLSDERGRVLSYLRKQFSVSDDDLDDIFQESSMALFLNVRDGKLSTLTSSLGTYFMKVCINQTLKFLGKNSKTMPLFDDRRITNPDFVRDDKKRNYYMITVKGEKRIDLKEFRKAHGTRQLSFASADDMMSIMKLQPGSVTPLGLLNDEDRKVKLYLDSSLTDGLIGVHPNDNTATVWMHADDLVRIIKEHGSEVEIVDMG